MRPHRVRANVLLVLGIVVRVGNAVIDMPSVPNLDRDAKFPWCTKGGTAFNELRRSFNGDPSSRQQEMDMVRHDREFM